MTWPFITKSRHEREIAKKDYELDCAHEVIGSLHEEIAELSDFEDKFKKAITDLAAATGDLALADTVLAVQKRDLDAFKADALAYRARLKRDREQKAAKRAAGRCL